MQLPIPLPLNAAKISLPALGAPFLLIVILAMVVLPLPPVLLDLLFTFNIVAVDKGIVATSSSSSQ